MPNREVRVSPDGKAVAVRTDADVTEWNAWGVIHSKNGGHWSTAAELEDWITLTVPAPAPDPS
jgi:hypothetical protein